MCIRELILRVFDAKVELLLSIFRDLSSASCRLCRVIPYVDEDVKWTALRTLSYDIVKNSKVYPSEKVSLFTEFITRIAGTNFEMETCDAHVHLCVAYY